MSEFLSRIKARLETGQHLNPTSAEETGWVRAALVDIEKESKEITNSSKNGNSLPDLANLWQTDLVARMKVVGLGSQDGCEAPQNLTVCGSTFEKQDDVSPLFASQKLWETGNLEFKIPCGFYSVIPSKSLKTQFEAIPTIEELKNLGTEAAVADVLLVDTSEDQIIVQLRELVIASVKSIESNPALTIKRIAEVVADFYGGPLFESGVSRLSVESDSPRAENWTVQLLGQIKVGLCRPRAILFKFLGDAVGLPSRLLMGLQLEAVPSSSLICSNPNKHLSNVVLLNGMELLVDVMRHPGHLRPFSRKALVTYHIAGAGDSDSADYDSCDSPLEPNSPLFAYPDKMEVESPDQEMDSPSVSCQRRGRISPAAATVMSQLPLGVEGKLSPSRSEPDLANPFRRRSRRKAMTDERAANSSPELVQHPQSRSNIDGVRSFPSSPEHPQARFRSFRRVGSGGESVSSSPEHPTARVRVPSMLGGSRRHGLEESDQVNVSSPEHSPISLDSAKPSPIFRRRSVAVFGDGEDNGSKDQALSIDVNKDKIKMDFFRSGDISYSRINYSPDIRRPKKRSVAPEVSDAVVSAVRAMNQALKKELSKAPEHSEINPADNKVTTGVMVSDQETYSIPSNSKSIPSSESHAPNSRKVSSSYEISTESFYHLGAASTGGTKTDSDGKEGVQVKADCFSKGTSSSDLSDSRLTSWEAMPRAQILLNQSLMPFAEWNIDFDELRIGVRVGIGSFGEVFRGIWRGTEVAIKVMLEQDINEQNTEDFCNEISLLSRLRHPNVILFMGACTKPPHLSMVTEYMHLGSLYCLVHTTGQGKKLSWRRRLKMLRDICRGMMCVQRMNIVHRDLKSANCLVDKHWSVKICDFGLSRIAQVGTPVEETAAAGTPEWMAPELLRNEPVTDKCDVFSLGVIMWELCTLKRPWEGVKPTQVVYAVAHDGARLEIPEGLLGKLIADCWAEVPTARPSYDEILTRLHECEFLQG